MSRFAREASGRRRNHQVVWQREAPSWFRIAIATAGSFAVLSVGLFGMRLKEGRADDGPPSGAASPLSQFVIDSRVKLVQLQAKLAKFGTQALAGVDTTEPTADDVAIQARRVETAKVGLHQAVLAREAAELALKEYQDGVFPQEKKACEVGAGNGAGRARTGRSSRS